MKKGGFWNKYYEAKKLSGQSFYEKRFRFIEVVIISLVVAFILTIIETLAKDDLLLKLHYIVIFTIIAILVYRYLLFNRKNQKNLK